MYVASDIKEIPLLKIVFLELKKYKEGLNKVLNTEKNKNEIRLFL